jgi:murein DD-endopeptidase MepM/ murein hydrolase activator NlpD
MHKADLKRIMINFVRIGLALIVSVQISISGFSATGDKRSNLNEHGSRVSVRAVSLDPTGMAKPIADLRDYNGTYFGASGTGTRGYENGTLYRDNEDNGVTSGCNGEGCGRHPGVDIPVPSGTPVYAALGGTVRISRCGTDGWGGLMVIQSTNPWNPSESIYFVYGHLKARNYNAGQGVLTGKPIGLSGGGAGDACRGNSTGSHLHFQIDKEDGSPEPYFPSASGLNQRDTDFQVTNRTYNPVVFVTGGYRWSFNKPGERELWDLANWQRWGVSNDALWVDGVGDTFISRGFDTPCGQTRPCSSRIAVEANMYPKVYLDLYNVCFNNPGKIYFTTSTSPNFDEQKTVSYFPNGQGSYQAHIFMNQNPLWTGIITGLRIDPAVSCSSGDDPTYYGEITVER